MVNFKSLLKAELIKPGDELRSMSSRFNAKAVICSDGCLLVNEQKVATPESAMTIAVQDRSEPLPSGSAWQFWGCYNQDRQSWTPIEHLRAEFHTSQTEDQIKTSSTHPLRVDYVKLDCGGRIGMTLCPGKQGRGLYSGQWQRDLDQDINRIEELGYRTVISLMEMHEFDRLGVGEFSVSIQSHAVEWIHLPIKDMCTPDFEFEQSFSKYLRQLLNFLAAGGSIVLHCRGGLGRTGMIAARLLVETGQSPQQAIEQVRKQRPNAIETFAQEEYILNQNWKLNLKGTF
ncbi:dual specificity protein phosphatase family protein [Pleionea mediterranea]|uniref:protein-tyrosine-phosphatase n=1 Tax=Pleionea mediterranea TaxID=523701 RepID=A0A316FP37_9GAMM|nr:dual specificity protein phosphatase family protein [Pleionea mediterranea]PWK49872.1 hypothetical protein C8D97_10733 [Pleionea mediterranea]